MRFSFPVLVLLATSLSTAYEVPEKRNCMYSPSSPLTIEQWMSYTDLTDDNKPVYAGKYAIYDCNSNASIVKQDLDSLWDILQLVLADLNAPATGAAFDTFFKEKRNKGFVKKVLQNVADGAAVRKSGRHRGYDSQSPVFLCRNQKPPKHDSSNEKLALWRIFTHYSCLQNPRPLPYTKLRTRTLPSAILTGVQAS